jgi:hypothetical protein
MTTLTPAIRFVLVLVASTALAAACDGESTSSEEVVPPHAVDAIAPERVTTTESYRVGYVPTPDPIPVDVFALRIEVDAGAAPPGDLSLSIDALMVEHGHGMIGANPVVTKLDADTFEVEGMDFIMPGLWQITMELRAGDRVETALFEVELPP